MSKSSSGILLRSFFVCQTCRFDCNSESVRAWQKLKIVTQPQDVICDENEVIRFTVEAIGVGTLEYQWQYFELALSDWGWQNIIDE